MCNSTSAIDYRFSYSSIEQQYVAESLQSLTRQHKTSSRECITTTNLGKRRMKGKCGQSSSFHKRGVLDASYNTYGLHAFAGGECINQTAKKGTVMELNGNPSKVDVAVVTKCKHVIIDQQVGEKSKILDSTTTDVRKVYARRAVIPSSTFKSRKPFIWYVEVYSYMYIICVQQLIINWLRDI